MANFSYYIIKRTRQYDEIVKSRSIRVVRHGLYIRPDAASIISIKKAHNGQVKNYLTRTGKTDDEIEIIKNEQLWYKKTKGEP